MQLSNKPDKLVLPFAASGAKNTIPANSQIGIVAGKASLTDGFPPLTRAPLAAGGVPPSGLDMNGILYEMSAVVRWANAGGGYPFDSTFAADVNVGGYPKGSRVLRSDGLGYWFNTADNQTVDPEDAGAPAAGWVPDFTSGAAAITMTGSNVTLTPLQYGKRIIMITGALRANLNLIFPSIAGEWVVLNKCTGAFAITCKTAAGTGIATVPGSYQMVASEGVNIYAIGADLTVAVEDFGADPTGTADSTAAFVAAFASGARHVEASGVKYEVGQFAIPSTCKRFYSRSGALLTPAASVPSGVTVANWITWSSTSNGKMWGFEINAPIATYPNLTVLSLFGCTKMKLQDMQMPEAGRIGVYLGNCTYCKVIDVDIYEFTYKGVAVDGTTSGQSVSNQVLFSNVEGSGSAHAISFVNGQMNSAFGNQTGKAVTFGIGFNNAQGGIAALNMNFNTGHEAINLEDSNRVIVAMNNADWPTTASNSTDFGMSVFGNATESQFNALIGNIVTLSGASGIALADDSSYNLVKDNVILTCNIDNIANHGGILMYGTNCNKNQVSDNFVVDAIGTHHKYGIIEHNFGTGSPSINTIAQNFIEGFVTGDITRINKSTAILLNSADLDAFRTYTPTVTSAAGTITTASATGYYMELGDIILTYARATITTNGTGATSVSISAPFPGASKGSGSGKELGLTGKALTVEVGANFSVRNYDNTYPGANGAILDIFVIYQRA